MRSMKVSYFGILFLMVLSSCDMIRYMKKRETIVDGSYSKDTLYINGYVFYDDVVNSWGISQSWSPYMNSDSVFTVFKTALFRIKNNIVVKEGNFNFSDSTFHRNWGRRFDNDLLSRIISITQGQGKLHLVPLIKMTQAARSGMYFTSSGAAGGSRYLIQNQLELVIYLIKDNSIIYSRAAFCLGRSYPAYDLKEIQHTLTQQDWDELVALVMKDYVDRLQDGTEMNKLD